MAIMLGIKMNINLTLIVQAINFFIAYCLFRFILLKPAYGTIVEEQETKASIEQLISDHQKLIERRRQEMIQYWRESSTFFRKNMPIPIDHIALFKGTYPKIKLKSEKISLTEMQRKLVHAVVRNVRGDYVSR